MPLGREVGLSPNDIVLDEDPATPPQKGAQPLNFRPMSIVAKRLDGSMQYPLGTKVDLSTSHIVLDGDPAPLHPSKRGTAPPSFRPMFIAATVAHLSLSHC